MSSNPRVSPEPGMTGAGLEDRLRRVAAALPYPETPDLAGRERQRIAAQRGRPAPGRKFNRLAVGLAVLFILAAAALLVQPVRARVLDWIRLGAVRIFLIQPAPTPTQPLPAGTPSPAVRPIPSSTPTVLQSVLDLSGETTLAEAQAQVDFDIRLPTFPADLGSPDHAYLQTIGRPVVVMVWVDPNQPGKVRMSLSETASNEPIFEKNAPQSVRETQVGGRAALWVDGEYLLVMRNGDVTLTRLITQGHTLIWTIGEMTYRLETDENLETAIRIAESIR